jgi:FkbM family methyltransferase
VNSKLENLLSDAGFEMYDGKALLPDWCRRIKIDVGLSHNAPQSRRWIESDPNLLVIGFEPVSANVSDLKLNYMDNPEYRFHSQLKKQLYILPVALGPIRGLHESRIYVTSNDRGQSSLLEPKDYLVATIQDVSVTSLETVLDFFSFEDIQYIDYLKTDAQGCDFEIVQGLGKYSDLVLAITTEAENLQYIGSNNANGALTKFLLGLGFTKISNRRRLIARLPIRTLTDDPTFLHLSRYQMTKRCDLTLYQQG